MEFCRDKKVDEEIITACIKNCEKQTTLRNLMLTQRYLKENQLLAVPFYKGIKKITDLPQFQKVEPTRKNAKNPYK